ncbi:Oidioi.mRNA.OKI2018_I69.chr1.g1238.t1.cds [Oikopleura dioica]|uniref:Oidioi.mRNA.OKI2018_I69.chr1.g1238.t1.cds n=1 Tax=Oikopleura dioica TaxID=34765 RepID=A0ABN7SRK3_OIKDI|nr:Oidioi.mRNA.OKI2018_I69.chr1.g1238.t1.cds [Oikopleura dioica]
MLKFGSFRLPGRDPPTTTTIETGSDAAHADELHPNAGVEMIVYMPGYNPGRNDSILLPPSFYLAILALHALAFIYERAGSIKLKMKIIWRQFKRIFKFAEQNREEARL